MSHYINKYFKDSIIYVSDESKININGIVRICTGCKIDIRNGGILTIGNNTQINDDCKIGSKTSITIGENVVIGDNTQIHDFDGHIINRDNYIETKPIIIENNVWIGKNVTILKGVHIGENVIIAAGSVVTKDIPSNSMVAGVSAKLIKTNIDWS